VESKLQGLHAKVRITRLGVSWKPLFFEGGEEAARASYLCKLPSFNKESKRAMIQRGTRLATRDAATTKQRREVHGEGKRLSSGAAKSFGAASGLKELETTSAKQRRERVPYKEVGATAKAAQRPGEYTRGNSHYPRKEDNPGGLSVAHREGKDLKKG
jgi:hypothetical protein